MSLPPDPLAVLRARTEDAIGDLGAIGSHDPAGVSAIHAVKLAVHTLQHFWAPALDESLSRRGPT